MTSADASTTTETMPEAHQPLIADAWRRAKRLLLAYLQVRHSADAVEVSAMAVQLQALGLLIAATPAEHMDDLVPKVLCAALFRGPLAHLEGHTLAMIELAISRDTDRLQPFDADLAGWSPRQVP